MAVGARTHFRTCHLCEAMCGIAIELEGERIVAIRGDKDDPFSRGHICPKAVALQDVHEDPDRLRRPLRRTASGWEEVSWDEALDEAAARLAAVQRAHGRNAVALYQGNPVVHNHGALLFGQLFQRSLGSRSRYSATSVDQLPQMLASLLMFGHQLLLPIPDVDRTDFLLVLGANPLVSNGSLMTAPGIERRLKALRGSRRAARRGGPAPHRDGGARRPAPPDPPGRRRLPARGPASTRWRARAPGGPAASRRSPTASSALAEAVRPFSPEAVAGRTGIDAATIRTLARDFAAAASAVAYGRVGICTQEFGGLASWLVNALNVVTGNLDRPGGAMFTGPGGRPRGVRGPHRPARPLRQGQEPRARAARVRRRVARGGAGRGDRDARRRPGPRARDELRATRCSRRPTAPGSTARSPRSTSWCRSTSTSTRPRATRT